MGVEDPNWCSWFAGFVDGEGCFRLHHDVANNRNNVKPLFSISLRDDDSRLLNEIHRILGVGTVTYYTPKNKNGVVKFRTCGVKAAERLIDVIESGSGLRAKKERDYEIWKQAVEAKKNGASVAELLQLKQELQSVREYRKL